MATNQERVIKMQESICKIETTLKKWQTRLEKLEAQDATYPYEMTYEKWWQLSDEQRDSKKYEDWFLVKDRIRDAKDGIKNNTRKLDEKKKSLENLLAKIEKENERDKTIPPQLVEFMEKLIKNWDDYDDKRKLIVEKRYQEFYKAYKQDCDEHLHDAWYRSNVDIQQFGTTYQEYFYYHDHDKEYFHNQNVKEAKNIVIGLMNRVKAKCGNIQSCAELKVQSANQGICLNGFVKGDKGTAVVESILAGGYNIQRLHIRVLVK